MAMNIKYRPLKAFLLAVDCGSFTRAADQLGVTQPSFTALIHDLEEVLGVRLFERSTRSLRLTPAGEEFFIRVQRPLTDLEEGYRSILDLAAVKHGSIVMGALPSTSLALIPATLGELRVRQPALRVRVIEGHNAQLIEMLRTNQIEFALATMLEPHSGMKFLPLLQDTFSVVMPLTHILAARSALYWRDLPAHDLILLSQGSSVRALFDHAVEGEAATSSSSSHYDVTHMTTAVGLVRQGLGVTVLPRLALPELNLQGLLNKPIQDLNAKRTIGVLHRQDRSLSPAAQLFVDRLVEVIKMVEKKLPPLQAAPR